jgi:surface antigen
MVIINMDKLVTKKLFITSLLVLFTISGCARFESERIDTQTSLPNKSINVATQSAILATDIKAFLDPDAELKLSEKEKKAALSAQFYALQFGRPGAPRNWQGETGASGKILVGPYVRVNILDCREFEHIVQISKITYSRTGTACREKDGSWSVVDI